MNKTELMKRLDVLQSTGVVSEEAAAITAKTFDHLVSVIEQDDILQGEMLFTHLSIALTRLERGEKIEGPPDIVLTEIKSTGFADRVNKEIAYIEKQLGMALPDAEKHYLHLHYASVLQQHSGR